MILGGLHVSLHYQWNIHNLVWLVWHCSKPSLSHCSVWRIHLESQRAWACDLLFWHWPFLLTDGAQCVSVFDVEKSLASVSVDAVFLSVIDESDYDHVVANLKDDHVICRDLLSSRALVLFLLPFNAVIMPFLLSLSFILIHFLYFLFLFFRLYFFADSSFDSYLKQLY